jgi:hypothetical protein
MAPSKVAVLLIAMVGTSLVAVVWWCLTADASVFTSVSETGRPWMPLSTPRRRFVATRRNGCNGGSTPSSRPTRSSNEIAPSRRSPARFPSAYSNVTDTGFVSAPVFVT